MSDGMYTAQEYQLSGYPQLIAQRHENMIWTRFATIALGIWLFANVFTFAGESVSSIFNDALSGILLVVFGVMSLQESKRWAPWAAAGVGVWLEIAPLFFHAASSYAYLNDTLVGIIAIALSILIPGTPGLIEYGPEVPNGWSYNPSSWVQRLPVVAFAFFAWMIARFMAAYELGYIQTIIDPLFKEGTMDVVNSSISHAGLVAFFFTIVALLGCKGGSRRWHSMPWAVALFGFLIIPLGIIMTISILLQPLTVGSGCFWCLVSAALMLAMMLLTADEVMASAQFLWDATRDGKPFWPTFWHGSMAAGGHVDLRSPSLYRAPKTLLTAMCWGVTVPWNLVASTLIGVWLLSTGPLVAKSHSVFVANQVLGAFIVILSILAMAEVFRTLRYINVLFGLFLGITPWVFADAHTAACWNNTVSGLLLIFLSIPRGEIMQQYGSIDRLIR